jgi:hypothetical protein
MELRDTSENRRQFRCNVIDERGTVSFVAPPHGLKVLAAAIARGSSDVVELMNRAMQYDAAWAESVKRDLMIFDEHNVDEVAGAFGEAIGEERDDGHHAFRVIDHLTRQRSLIPGGLGLVVFNLKERRIIQIHNSYDDLRRRDRGRVRIDGKPTDQLFHYELPREWAIVP